MINKWHLLLHYYSSLKSTFSSQFDFLIFFLLKGRKLKTTTEALENGQDTGIELKVQAQQQSNQQLPQQQQQPTTVTLNPALHSAAENISASAPPPARGHTCVRGRSSSSSNGSRRPPALVFTHDSSLNSSVSSSPSGKRRKYTWRLTSSMCTGTDDTYTIHGMELISLDL